MQSKRKHQNKASSFSPRPYLSWSQLNLWEKDQNMYYQVYVEGLQQFKTKYLELGKRMADGMQNGFDEEGDPMFEMLITLMPGYPQREHVLTGVLDGIPLKGVLDGWNKVTMTIGEYKTGKKWTQSMADNSGQLTFYALLVWLEYHKLPRNIFLHWARTEEDEEGNLMVTGDMQTFSTQRGLADLIRLSTRIKSAWKGICEMSASVKQQM